MDKGRSKVYKMPSDNTLEVSGVPHKSDKNPEWHIDTTTRDSAGNKIKKDHVNYSNYSY